MVPKPMSSKHQYMGQLPIAYEAWRDIKNYFVRQGSRTHRAVSLEASKTKI